MKDILETAVLGTSRADSPLSERALLEKVGVQTWYESVGQANGFKIEKPLAETVANTATLPPKGMNLLDKMVSGRHASHLIEFYTLCKAHGVTIPLLYLPNLLERAASRGLSRVHLLPVLGAAGQALAGQNPKWRFGSSDITHFEGAIAFWKSENVAKRQLLHDQWRVTDRDLARRVFASQWRTEKDHIRTRLLKQLASGLEKEDVPLLQRGLRDRAFQVRKESALLLSALPETAVGERVAQSSRALLSFKRKRLDVAPPTKIDPQLIHWGIITVRKKGSEAQKKTDQVRQLVMATPLGAWEDALRKSPAQICKGVPQSGWPMTLTLAFTEAARRQKNAVWAEAILRELPLETRQAQLINLIPDGEAFMIEKSERLAQNLPLTRKHPLVLLLGAYEKRWSKPLVERFLTLLEAHIGGDPSTSGLNTYLRGAIRKMGVKVDPECADFVADRLSSAIAVDDAVRLKLYESVIKNVTDALYFRQEMHRMFGEI